ncbi:7226_t:CDS:2 [Entrophospora sp. SA101]|nr:4575_t:CDS:2 [Entrophospora sp. SA101]CAJ0639418.1 15475_t:CDS:2 [Entrophospora sp. SA101]CAJ0766336.1 7226_t:CDS:2 [Entrophospora sp. SA101]CAJ0823701.1 2208_t:CDS:2 [Entrophospora sp. SA101]CAJ0852466.1 960_t:CDS:2 [Entrophospora sp. SA101]
MDKQSSLIKNLFLENLLPKLFIFDLDYTIWPLWIDTHVSGPVFKADPNKPFIALDGYSTKIQLYNDVPKIFQLIKGCSDTKLAVASRTEEPEW